MLYLYRIAREFDSIKSKITVLLSENQEASIYYNKLYSELIIENYKKMFEELLQLKETTKPRIIKEKEVPDKKQFSKRRRYSKKLMQKKLNIALKKQKSGKKLDFYELKLILDHSKGSD
jgi:hypothetical protein